MTTKQAKPSTPTGMELLMATGMTIGEVLERERATIKRLESERAELVAALDQAALYLEYAEAHTGIGNPLKNSIRQVAGESRSLLARLGAE